MLKTHRNCKHASLAANEDIRNVGSLGSNWLNIGIFKMFQVKEDHKMPVIWKMFFTIVIYGINIELKT